MDREDVMIEQKRPSLRRKFKDAGMILIGVTTVFSLGYVLESSMDMGQMINLAGIGPGLYAQALQLPHS
jgi:hypothetical protein